MSLPPLPAPISPLTPTPEGSWKSNLLGKMSLSLPLPKTSRRAEKKTRRAWSPPKEFPRQTWQLGTWPPAVTVLPDSPPAPGVDLLHFGLPFGWRKMGKLRQLTRQSQENINFGTRSRGNGTWDWILYSPTGTQLRGRMQLKAFFRRNPGVSFSPSVTHHSAPWSKKKVSGLNGSVGVGPPKKKYPRLNLFK